MDRGASLQSSQTREDDQGRGMVGTPHVDLDIHWGATVYIIMLRIGTGWGLCIATGEGGVVLFLVLSHRTELDSFTALLRAGWWMGKVGWRGLTVLWHAEVEDNSFMTCLGQVGVNPHYALSGHSFLSCGGHHPAVLQPCWGQYVKGNRLVTARGIS